MKFEYDPDKSAANREKHGIDFDEAQALWDDPYLIEAPANVTDEPRFLAVGMIGARHWTAVYTYRSDRVRKKLHAGGTDRSDQPGKAGSHCHH